MSVETQHGKICQLCKDNPKDWQGTDPTCAFRNDTFSGENFQCATIKRIRALALDMCESHHQFKLATLSNEEKFAIIPIENIPAFYDKEATSNAIALWVQWYKSRGCTSSVLIMFSDGVSPRPPTEEECVVILMHYNYYNRVV